MEKIIDTSMSTIITFIEKQKRVCDFKKLKVYNDANPLGLQEHLIKDGVVDIAYAIVKFVGCCQEYVITNNNSRWPFLPETDETKMPIIWLTLPQAILFCFAWFLANNNELDLL
jgi:hypothetical protein